ncbi:MAG: polyprenyl diphosphate synthase, partial [Chloroflexota bacterium]
MSAPDKKPLPENIPAHVAIIMDGNGRWAKQRGLPRVAGHRAGTDNLRRVIEACVEFGIRTLTIYAFSTENWRRPAEEVNGLMTIFEDVIDRELPELNKNGVQLRHIGRLDGLKPAFANKVRGAIEATRHNNRLILNVAFNYGGRSEIVEAVRRIVAEGASPESITENVLAAHLYTGG